MNRLIEKRNHEMKVFWFLFFAFKCREEISFEHIFCEKKQHLSAATEVTFAKTHRKSAKSF